MHDNLVLAATNVRGVLQCVSLVIQNKEIS